MRKSANSTVQLLRRLYGAFAASIALTACQHLGPWALEEGRERYNEKIHLTSRDQLFANIVRVAYSEPPLFMDVSEVDATEFIQGAVSGGLTGLGTLLAEQGAGPAVPTSATAGALSSKVVTNRAGAVGGSIQYQETPTIRYFPLSGQPLVAQISTPINVVSIANLATSDWPLLSVIDFATDRATPRYTDNFAAINAVAALDDYGALVIAAGKSDATRPAEPKPQVVSGTGNYLTIQTAPPSAQATDALILYLQPDHPSLDPLVSNVEETSCTGEKVEYPRYYKEKWQTANDDMKLLLAKRNIMHFWIRLLRLYAGTQKDDPLANFKDDSRLTSLIKQNPKISKQKLTDDFLESLDERVASLNLSQLDADFARLPQKIELRSTPVPTTQQQPVSPPNPKQPASGKMENTSPSNKAPVLSTHSALGILLNAPQQPTIEFVTRSAFEKIIHQKWNSDSSNTFYTLTASDENSLWSTGYGFFYDSHVKDTMVMCVSDWIVNTGEDTGAIPHSFSIMENTSNYSTMMAERTLGHLRRYILVIKAEDSAPTNAFVSYTNRGETFYIDGGDVVSRRNLALLAQFMTMQAIPSPNAPLTPTISVGG